MKSIKYYNVGELIILMFTIISTIAVYFLVINSSVKCNENEISFFIKSIIFSIPSTVIILLMNLVWWWSENTRWYNYDRKWYNQKPLEKYFY